MPSADNQVTLTLPDNFAGQVLDGLNVLIEQWDATAAYHEHGDVDEDIIIRECTDAREAISIADWYREIAGMIRTQRDAQRVSPRRHGTPLSTGPLRHAQQSTHRQSSDWPLIDGNLYVK